MSLNNIKIVDINTENIATSDFGSNSEVVAVGSNLDSFASYANSTFSSGPSFTAGQLLNAPILYTDYSNANSAYATSNVVSLSTAVNSGDNLLVYLDGLLQHPDTYVLLGSSIQFANVDPLPSNITVGVRYLATPSTLIANTGSANQLNSANGSILWDYESKRLYVYDGITEGGFYANATQTIIPYIFQGSISGYTSGGYNINTVDKFSFTTNGNATDVGDLTQGRDMAAGQSSLLSGYTSGGRYPVKNTIDKFSFFTDGNATDVGDLTELKGFLTGQSSSESGYTSGGAVSAPTITNVIEKFPFSSDGNATDVGDLTVGRRELAGQSSTTSGYSSGGNSPTTTLNTIDKFPFAAAANASDVGDLTAARRSVPAGQSSDVSGYTSGGTTTGATNIIDRFPFSTNANATDVGDLTQGRYRVAGQSSTTYGYASGGGPGSINIIDRFPFATNVNATDVGDLTLARYGAAGQQR